MRGDHATGGMQQTTQQRRRHRVRRTGHDVEWPARQSQVRRVGLHEDDPVSEAATQVTCPSGVPFDGDDAGAGVEQRLGDRA